MGFASTGLLTESTARSVKFKGSAAMNAWKASMTGQPMGRFFAAGRQVGFSVKMYTIGEPMCHFDSEGQQVGFSISSWQTSTRPMLSDPVSARSFFDAHPEIESLIKEAASRLQAHFGTADLVLSIVNDHGSGFGPRAVLEVRTSLAPREAVDALRAFDQAWWLDRLQLADDLLTITIGYS